MNSMATPPRPNFNLNNIVAPDVGGSLIDLANMQSKQFQLGLSNVMAEEQARRAREQAEREKLKFDKEVNTDKALIDFQNQIASASSGGVASMEQGAQLANEYDRLLKTVGEDEAARIINDKAQKFGAQDAKRAENDPYYRAELIKGVSLPSGNIDPKSLIDLRNSQIMRNETLGDRKEDARLTAEERAYQREMDRKRFALQQKEYNERALDKANAKKAIAEFTASSMIEDKNRSSSGAYYNVNQVNTGNKILKDGVLIPENEGSEDLAEMNEITNRINSLSSKNINEDGNEINYEDRDKAFEAYKKENPEAANSSEAGKVVDRAFEGAVKNVSDGMINGMSLPGKILAVGLDKAKPLFMTDIEKEEYNKKLDEAKAKELQESLKSNSPGEKAKPGNISFDDYWKLKKDQQALDNAELGRLQKELGEKSVSYYDNLANKYGEDEVKSVPKEMTPHEARIHATKNTVKSLIERGVDEENALKLAIQEGEKAEKFQANYLNTVNKDAKEKAKNKYTEVKDQRKKLEDKIATLEKRKFEIGKNKESKIVYNKKTVKLSEAQAGLDDEISMLKKELADIK